MITPETDRLNHKILDLMTGNANLVAHIESLSTEIARLRAQIIELKQKTTLDPRIPPI